MKGYGLIVYDASTNRTCRVESDYMKPSDKNFSLGNQSFTYDYGIFSMTPFCNDLYFSAVSSKEIYKIKIKKLLECPGKQEANNHTKLAIKIPSQTGQVTTVGHSIIYNDSKGTSLMGTNVCNKSDNKTVVLAKNDELIRILSAIKPWRDYILLVEDNFQDFILSQVNFNNTLFRIMEVKVSEIRKEME
ncbi:hypothetical protein PUN28_011283 [Cardiocondyla obscurior]